MKNIKRIISTAMSGFIMLGAFCLSNITTCAAEDSSTVKILIYDDCSDLKKAEWTVSAPMKGVYITDSGNTNGKLYSESDTKANKGEYLFFADGSGNEKDYALMRKVFPEPIGTGPWMLEFEARIKDLITFKDVPGYGIYRGLTFDIIVSNRVYKITFNDKNKILHGDWASWDTLAVKMPEDDDMHKWAIAYDGNGKLIITLDRVKIGTFKDKSFVSESEDMITIGNIPQDNYESGTTDVTFGSIKFTKGTLPDWALNDPRFGGCSVLPGSSAEEFQCGFFTKEIPEEWYSDGEITIRGIIEKDGEIVSETSSVIKSDSACILTNTGGKTGEMTLKLSIAYNGRDFDEMTMNVFVNSKETLLVPGQKITTVPGESYLFNYVEYMKTSENIFAAESGWNVGSYKYPGSDNTINFIEGSNTSSELILPLELDGRVGVYIGYITGSYGVAKVKLGSDPFDMDLNRTDMKIVDRYGEQLLGEIFVTAADFNPGSLSILPPSPGKARIAYIRFIGLTDDEFALYTKPDEGESGKRVVYNNDANSDIFSQGIKNADDIRKRDIDRYIGQDVEEIDYCIGVTFQLNYNSAFAGEVFEDSEKHDHLMRDGDKRIRSVIRRIIADTGKAPIEIAGERAHENGFKLNASLRMNAFYDQQTYPWLNGKIYPEFDDCRYIDINGKRSNNISYAYPKVQEYILNILKEIASLDNIDGINLDYCRYPDIIGYEALVCEAYESKYGLSPQSEKSSEGLNRWYQFRSDIITEFMRKVRETLDGKQLTVRVPFDKYFECGLDVKQWIKEGLIDVVIPSCISYETFYDITPFAEAVKGTDVVLWGGINADLAGHDLTKAEEDLQKRGVALNLHSASLNTRQYRLRAYELYQAGAEKLYIFNDWSGNNSLGLLGDKTVIEKWRHFEYPSECVQNYITVSKDYVDRGYDLPSTELNDEPSPVEPSPVTERNNSKIILLALNILLAMATTVKAAFSFIGLKKTGVFKWKALAALSLCLISCIALYIIT